MLYVFYKQDQPIFIPGSPWTMTILFVSSLARMTDACYHAQLFFLVEMGYQEVFALAGF
jgi:hypothetical protein